MSSDELVLLKSKAQRFVEMVAIPTVSLTVGPAMRALLGDQYSPVYGLLAMFPLMFLMTAAGSGLAPRYGGEWVSRSERLRRLTAEVAATPCWQTVLATMAMTALTLLGLFLVVDPIDDLGNPVGGPLAALSLIALISALSGGQVLFSRRRLRRSVVVEGKPPAGYVASEVRGVLPRIYLAYVLGTGVGVVVGSQFRDVSRFFAFVAASLVASMVLLQVFSYRRAPRQLYAPDLRLGSQMLMGALLCGMPMGIIFSGAAILTMMGHPGMMVIAVGVAIAIGGAGGFAFGAFIYLSQRLADRRRRRDG